MAKAARTDDVIFHANGSVEMKYTEGDYPLPAEPSTVGNLYASRTELIEAIVAAEGRIASDLKFLQWAKSYKGDPAIGNTFVNDPVIGCKGKTSILDMQGTPNTLIL